MSSERSEGSVLIRLGIMFFLIGMSPGFYVPILTNILLSNGLGDGQLQWAWLAFPVAALVSPLWVGALADHRCAAQRLMGVANLVSAALLAGSFAALQAGWNGWWFVAGFGLSSIVGAPTWSLLATICLRHLRSREREFPIVRLGGTLGWLTAGYVTSLVLHADASPVAGYASAVVRLIAGLLAFGLPETPPLGQARSWRALLGLDAFALLRERDQAVFFATTALLSMPLVAFYMWLPAHLEALGDPQVAATMAFGQVSEVMAMVLMATLIGRFRVKTLLLTALWLAILRYGLFAWAGVTGERMWLAMGIGLHGLCYTLYFITAQLFLDRRVAAEMRGQAQGLLVLVSAGLGSLLGTIGVRAWHDAAVVKGDGGWALYWAGLAGVIVVIAGMFHLCYRGRVASSGGVVRADGAEE